MALILEQVTKVVESHTHIQNVSLKIEPNCFNILLGGVQAGKTTLLRLIAGLDRLTTGRILLDKQDLTNKPTRQRNVAMVYQEFVNYPTLSVYENIASPLRLQQTNKTSLDRKVRGIADLLALTDMLQRRPTELSGGQQQRTALARALAKDADILLLDEPLANLDYKLREELRTELPKLLINPKTIVMYATTDPTEALLLGGNTVVLQAGTVVQFGPAKQTYDRPQNLATAEIFSDPPLNRVTANINWDTCKLPNDITIPTPPHMKSLPNAIYTLGIRPQYVSLSKPCAQSIAMNVQIMMMEETGSETIIYFEFGNQRWIGVLEGSVDVEENQTLTVYLDTRHFFLFDEQGQTMAWPEFFE